MLCGHRRSKGSIEGCLACRGLGASGVVMGGVTLGDVAGYYASLSYCALVGNFVVFAIGRGCGVGWGSPTFTCFRGEPYHRVLNFGC